MDKRIVWHILWMLLFVERCRRIGTGYFHWTGLGCGGEYHLWLDFGIAFDGADIHFIVSRWNGVDGGDPAKQKGEIQLDHDHSTVSLPF